MSAYLKFFFLKCFENSQNFICAMGVCSGWVVDGIKADCLTKDLGL